MPKVTSTTDRSWLLRVRDAAAEKWLVGVIASLATLALNTVLERLGGIDVVQIGACAVGADPLFWGC
jgi:hypothetical protein